MTRSTAELGQYLAGEWLFNNDFKDTSGNDNDGTPTDIEWKPTLRGMKPRFNGSSSLVNCGNDSSLDIGTSDFSIHCKIEINENKTHAMISKGLSGLSIGFITRIGSDNKLRLIMSSTGINNVDYIENDFILQYGVLYDIILTCDRNGNAIFYLDGVQGTGQSIASQSGSITNIQDVTIGRYSAGNESNGITDYCQMYFTLLTETEALNLYNETKDEYGVMPAEHSFTHNPDDVIDPSDAVGAWGTAKESTTELVDLSGNGNIATIKGPMPAEGFIQSRRYGSIRDYLDCGNDPSLNPVTAITIEVLINSNSASLNGIVSRFSTDNLAQSSYNFMIWDASNLYFMLSDGTIRSISLPYSSQLNVWTHLVLTFEQPNVFLYANGVQVVSETLNYPLQSSTLDVNIGNAYYYANRYFNGSIDSVRIYNHLLSETKIKQNFNTLARLPFWSVNYTDYPDNVTEYTDNLPYSSSIISSGTFKVDDDVLNCVSAGTITYRASYEFDGSEYIKVEIGGVEYAGTGTITQGNTTVSVAQGSNKITIEMGTGDTIDGDGIDIQFREEV